MAYPTNSYTGAKNLVDLCLAIREDVTGLIANQGTLTSLTTTAKTNLVSAINELVTGLKKAQTDIANKSEIDDSSTGTTSAWSAYKVASAIADSATQVKNDILGGAGTAFDTLQELATLIETNADAIDALRDLGSGHVKFDEAQSLTDAQKTQARTNIGAASASDLEAVQQTANGASSAVAGLSAAIGDPHVDLVTIYKNGYTE